VADWRWLVHNAVAHPLMAFFPTSPLVLRLHDRTSPTDPHPDVTRLAIRHALRVDELDQQLADERTLRLQAEYELEEIGNVAGRLEVAFDVYGIAHCRSCGCTDLTACDPPCSWVADPEQIGDLCSACLEAEDGWVCPSCGVDEGGCLCGPVDSGGG